MSIDVTILGPIGATADDCPLPLGDRKQRQFFAILAYELQLVEKARLVRCLWDEDGLLANRDDQLQTYAKGIRAALAGVPNGRDLLQTVRRHGYRLAIKPEQVDRHRFAALKARAETAERDKKPGEAARFARRALREWSSPGGLYGGTAMEATESHLDVFVQPLRQEYRSVLLLRLRNELDCGRHGRLLPELAQLQADEDGAVDAELVRLHMIALFREGMGHQAAEVYQRYADALGVMGGFTSVKEIKELRNRILNGDETLKLHEADYADYGDEDTVDTPGGDESADTEPRAAAGPASAAARPASAAARPASGSTFTAINQGENGRIYQADSMTFHESSDGR
jgi:DNA-binding SARP family transcriptional activator